MTGHMRETDVPTLCKNPCLPPKMLFVGKAAEHSFVGSFVVPGSVDDRALSLDVSVPDHGIELILANCPSSSKCERRNGARAASIHFVNVRGASASPNGRTQYW